MDHLVYCDQKEKELARLLSNEKSMVVRGAAGKKAPYGLVNVGEKLYFMEKGSGKITARAVVDYVENKARLSDDEITAALEVQQSRLRLSEAQKKRWHKKCLVFVGFVDAEEIPPLDYAHPGGMDDWLILNQIDDVVKSKE